MSAMKRELSRTEHRSTFTRTSMEDGVIKFGQPLKDFKSLRHKKWTSYFPQRTSYF